MVTGALFALFLVYPTVRLLLKSILSENGMTMEFYHSVLTQKGFFKGAGKQFSDRGSQRASDNRTGIFSGLHHSLYKYQCKIQKRN